MALVKYAAGFAAFVALAAAAPAPQVAGGIQNDIVNVVKSDTDVDFDRHDHYDDHYWGGGDPDPLHHVYYETHGWKAKREAAPQVSGGIQNDIVNVVESDTDVDVHRDDYHHGHFVTFDPDPKHYYPGGRFYAKRTDRDNIKDSIIVIDSDHEAHVHHEDEGWHHGGHWKAKRTDRDNIEDSVIVIDSDHETDFHGDDWHHGGHWKSKRTDRDNIEDSTIVVNDEDSVDFHDDHWDHHWKRDVVGGIQNEIVNVFYDHKDYDFKDYDWYRVNDPDYLHHRYYLNDGDPKHHFYFNDAWYYDY